MSLTRIKLAVAVVGAAALVATCDEPGRIETERQTLALEGAGRAEVVLSMGAGELRIRSADQEALLEGSFEFNRERNRPVVDVHRSGNKAVVQIRRDRRRGISLGRIHNRWDLVLTKAVPLDFDIDLGAGESDIDLRGARIERIDIDMGVGELKLDLQGVHKESFEVKIDGGIGSAKLYLPAEVGVRVRIDGGLGSIDARGLTKRSGVYVNDAYGNSPVTIEIDIDAGIGSVDLRCESPARF
jgi:hypothetical protein